MGLLSNSSDLVVSICACDKVTWFGSLNEKMEIGRKTVKLHFLIHKSLAFIGNQVRLRLEFFEEYRYSMEMNENGMNRRFRVIFKVKH